jgi:hypothetical protein
MQRSHEAGSASSLELWPVALAFSRMQRIVTLDVCDKLVDSLRRDVQT